MTSTSSRDREYAVVGGGIIGAAVARQLTLSHPDAHVTLFEKESELSGHQTGHNSGVVHQGLYYTPGSLKATLCRRGVQLISSFCRDRGVAYEECGKVLVARDAVEEQRLEGIYEKAVANGVPDVRLVDRAELADIEPGAAGVRALHSPHTAIIDFPGVTRALAADVVAAGGDVRLSTGVRRLEERGDGVDVRFEDGTTERFRFVVVCAGLQSDRIARASGQDAWPAIVPFFGQYVLVDRAHEHATRGLVYPVPDPAYPFLGVHVTRRIDGGLMVGPNAFLSFSREGYHGLGLNVPDTLGTALNPGFWRFALKNLPTAFQQLGGVLSAQEFIAGAAELVPDLADARGHRATRGIRAQAMWRDGSLVEDFVIQHGAHATYVRNAPSPGATSSMAIAEHIVEQATVQHGLGA